MVNIIGDTKTRHDRLAKKITVKCECKKTIAVFPAECTGQGMHRCIEQGAHSWFNHSMDTFHANPHLSNIPAGYNADGEIA
jgi:hypothetical protein